MFELSCGILPTTLQCLQLDNLFESSSESKTNKKTHINNHKKSRPTARVKPMRKSNFSIEFLLSPVKRNGEVVEEEKPDLKTELKIDTSHDQPSCLDTPTSSNGETKPTITFDVPIIDGNRVEPLLKKAPMTATDLDGGESSSASAFVYNIDCVPDFERNTDTPDSQATVAAICSEEAFLPTDFTGLLLSTPTTSAVHHKEFDDRNTETESDRCESVSMRVDDEPIEVARGHPGPSEPRIQYLPPLKIRIPPEIFPLRRASMKRPRSSPGSKSEDKVDPSAKRQKRQSLDETRVVAGDKENHMLTNRRKSSTASRKGLPKKKPLKEVTKAKNVKSKAIAKPRRGSKSKPSCRWAVVGEPERRRLHLKNNVMPVFKECYSAAVHKCGIQVKGGDTISINVGNEAEANFAKIINIFKEPNEESVMATVIWYYRASHMETTGLTDIHEKEIFASRHIDTIDLSSVNEMVHVLTFNEYCRLMTLKKIYSLPEHQRPKNKMLWERYNLHGYERLNKLPKEETPMETVYFCHRVYDFGGKKILKLGEQKNRNYIYRK